MGIERLEKSSAFRCQTVGNKIEKPFEKKWIIKIKIYSKDQIKCMAFLSNLDDPKLIAIELGESYEGKKTKKYIRLENCI